MELPRLGPPEWLGRPMKRRMRAIGTAGLVFVILIAAQLVPARAQQMDEDGSELAEAYDKAFQELFEDPSDLDKSFRFAELAVRRGNFEGAISALERMLLLNPDLPRVRLELGVLYFRLGSFQLARSYLTRVRTAENVPNEVLGRVEVFLAQIESNLKRSKFSGSIFVGVRRQTNANAGPSTTSVLASGLQATLGDQFTKKLDSNGFITANIRHAFDLLNQDGDVWESGATVFASEQRKQKQLDLVFLEVNTGPRIAIFNTALDGASIRPFVTASIVYLQDSHYMDGYGGGFNVVLPINERARITLNIDGKRKIFHNDSDHPTASGQTGWEGNVSLGAAISTSPVHQIAITLRGTAQTSRDNFNAFRQYQITVASTRLIPLGVLPDPMSVNLSVTQAYKPFNAPNPAVDPNRKRADSNTRLSILTSIPVSSAVTIVGNVQRVLNRSNLPNFEYQNTIVSLGTSVRF